MSILNPGCVVAAGETTTLVGFTNLSLVNVQRFLNSQRIITSDAPVQEPPAAAGSASRRSFE